MSRIWMGCFALICFSLQAQSATQELRIQGSNTVGARLGPALAEGWLESQNYEIGEISENGEETRLRATNNSGDSLMVDFKAYGSSTGFRALQNREADLAMSSRPAKQKEVNALAAVGDLRAAENEYVIALDGIAVVVHPANPINALTKAQLKQIFSGQVKDWDEVGGEPGSIQLHARDDASGTFDVFRSLVLGKNDEIDAGAKRYQSNAELSDAVAADPNSIGFTGLAYVRSAKALAISDSGAPAIAPSRFTVATEDYALSRRLFFYLPGDAAGEAAHRLAEYAVSDAAQPIVDDTGFVSQRVRASAGPVGEQYPDRFLDMVEGAQRLSVNIRFKGRSIELDNKAKRDADRVRNWLQQNGKMDTGVMLFGFAEKDPVLPTMMLEISGRRTQQVAKYLRERGVKVVKARGFGGTAAVASNDTEQGRQKNRRVEIWVR